MKRHRKPLRYCMVLGFKDLGRSIVNPGPWIAHVTEITVKRRKGLQYPPKRELSLVDERDLRMSEDPAELRAYKDRLAARMGRK